MERFSDTDNQPAIEQVIAETAGPVSHRAPREEEQSPRGRRWVAGLAVTASLIGGYEVVAHVDGGDYHATAHAEATPEASPTSSPETTDNHGVASLQAMMPDVARLWSEYQANDPAQAEMVASADCESQEVLDMEPEQRLEQSLERMFAFVPNVEEYHQAIDNIVDIHEEAEATYPRNFAYDPNDPRLEERTNPAEQDKHFVLHFTQSPKPELDGMEQARDMDRLDAGTGYNYYINNHDGQATVYFTSSQYNYEVKDMSNGLIGVEVAACSQADVTTEQYKQLLYLTAHHLEANERIHKGEPITNFVNEYVVGHRELAGADGHVDFPAAITTPFKQRLIDFLVTDLGYER